MAFKDWIFFSRAQKRGIIVLLLLIMFTPVFSSLVTSWRLRKPPDNKLFIAEIERMEQHLAEMKEPVAGAKESVAEMKEPTASGNRPAVPTATGNRPAASGDIERNIRHQESPRQLAININLADSTDFTLIPGIGPVFSSRIVRYRNLLGGFFEKDQLLEVYGLDSTRYQQIRPHLLVDTTNTIRRIDLNKATFSDLIRHPYLDRNQVSALLRLREQHGPLHSPEDIRRSHLIEDADWRRLLPYLKTTDGYLNATD